MPVDDDLVAAAARVRARRVWLMVAVATLVTAAILVATPHPLLG